MTRRDLRKALRHAWKFGLAASCLAISVAVVLGLILSNPSSQPDQYVYGAASAPPQPDLPNNEAPKLARAMPVSSKTRAAAEGSNPHLKLISSGTAIDSDMHRAIVGTIENQGSEHFRYIQVSYRLFDAQGSEIGTASATTLGIEPHGSWRFSTTIDDDCAKYKLEKIDAW
jgi:hypothetical protein